LNLSSHINWQLSLCLNADASGVCQSPAAWIDCMDQFAQGRLRFKFAIAGGLVVVAALSIKQAHRYVIRVYALDRLVDSSRNGSANNNWQLW
jgi:phosphatidylethanolamine-binding protein (PEBP) family uncharacterized protein